MTEGYFNGVDDTPIQDRFAEGVILTALEWGPKAIAYPGDLEARTQIQWASIVALNGWVNAGTNGGYPVHMIEHTLSAYYDISVLSLNGTMSLHPHDHFYQKWSALPCKTQ